ncbi:MAG: hypothetical protein JWM10_3354 [Myxococcaceae bacterium]|nr:hypothetical protein [Myxococcaceae bacterium]
MVASTLALVVAVPMQLAAAAGVELAGGYDSTVLNQSTLSYGDGLLTRGAVDLQLGHRSETVRQLLRTRGEYYFTQGEGRSFDEGDFVSLTRYALHIEPSDDWLVEGDASYSLGQSSLLLGRGGSPFLSFQRGIFGEYPAQLRGQHNFGETWRGSLLGGVLGRHAVDIPVGLARNNMLTFVSALEAAHDFDDNNVGIAAARGEYFLIDGYANWVPRILGYAGLRHFFGEHTTLTVLGGVDSLADQNDVSKFFVGPYANVALSFVLPEEHFTFGVGTRYEYAIIGTTNCARPVPAGGLCATSDVVAGGTGRVWGGNLSALWRPGEGVVSFTADVTVDYGTSENADTTPGARRGATREVASVNLSALAGARFIIGRQLSFFARYNFLYSDIDAVIPGVITEIVRHVGMVGVTFALGSEDDGVTEPLIPYEELEALQDARAAGNAPTTPGVSGGDDAALTADPFDLASPDPGTPSGEAGSGWLAPTTGDDPNAPVDPEAPVTPGAPRPRNATQPSTHGGTQRSTTPVNHGNAPVAPVPPPSGDGAVDRGAAPQGESNP